MQLPRSPACRVAIISAVVMLMLHCSALQAQARPSTRQAYGAAYGHMACQASVLIEPNTTQELSAALAAHQQVAKAGGRSVKIRATHKFFHSTNTFACPSNTTSMYSPESGPKSPFGSPPDLSVGILLGGMNRVLSVDQATHRMRVQAGMTVRQLLKEATKNNMSVPLGSVPAFADLMLGGVLLTGAHGTNYQGRSNLGDIVLDMTWVDARGRVTDSPRSSPVGRAIAGGLGLVGVLTELTLQLGPPTHTAFETVWQKADDTIGSDMLEMLKETPRMLVVWRPDMGKFTAVRLREVSAETPETGVTQEIELPAILASAMGATLRTWEELSRPPRVLEEVMCGISREVSISHGWANDKSARVMKSGVGATNEMQSVGCGDQCAWEADGANLAMWDTHFTTELRRLPEWVEDVKAIIDKDFWAPGEAKKGKCMPPGYFWLRFGSGSDDYISPNSGLNGTVHLQMSFMTSRGSAPRWGIKHGHVLETLEQLTLCKYQGRPHWGKNHARTYTHPACPIRALYPKFDEFLGIRDSLDPDRVFEPPLFAKILAGAPPTLGPRCALSGDCFCSEDAHCGRGRACVASAAFPEFKACRRVAPSSRAQAAASG